MWDQRIGIESVASKQASKETVNGGSRFSDVTNVIGERNQFTRGARLLDSDA